MTNQAPAIPPKPNIHKPIFDSGGPFLENESTVQRGLPPPPPQRRLQDTPTAVKNPPPLPPKPQAQSTRSFVS